MMGEKGIVGRVRTCTEMGRKESENFDNDQNRSIEHHCIYELFYSCKNSKLPKDYISSTFLDIRVDINSSSFT